MDCLKNLIALKSTEGSLHDLWFYETTRRRKNFSINAVSTVTWLVMRTRACYFGTIRRTSSSFYLYMRDIVLVATLYHLIMLLRIASHCTQSCQPSIVCFNFQNCLHTPLYGKGSDLESLTLYSMKTDWPPATMVEFRNCTQIESR